MNKTVTRALVCALMAGVFFGGYAFGAETKSAPAKNVILLIGDGMGPQAMGLLMEYARLAPGSIYTSRESNLEKFINSSKLGVMLTYSAETVVIDSAGSGTQIAGGEFTLPQRIGVDKDGNRVETLLEKAKKAGKATGLVTTSYLQDATPASFGAHQAVRSMRFEISDDLLNNNIDVMLGGGERYFETPELLAKTKNNGYEVVYTKKELDGAKTDKILGLFGLDATPYAISKNELQPTLPQMAKKALSVLSKDKDGFFVMIEAGKIDWASHADHYNDAGLLLHEMLEFDQTLAYLVDYVNKHKDTLLVVTADHETGGFGFNYRTARDGDPERAVHEGLYYTEYGILDQLFAQKRSYNDMAYEYGSLPWSARNAKNMAAILSDGLGREITPDFVSKNGNSIKKVKAALDDKDGIVWAAGQHTSTPVMVMVYGASSDGYEGVYHHTQLNKKIKKSAGF